MKIYTAFENTNSKIEEVESIEEGLQLIAEYEEEDRANGNYEENYYNLVDENGDTIKY